MKVSLLASHGEKADVLMEMAVKMNLWLIRESKDLETAQKDVEVRPAVKRFKYDKPTANDKRRAGPSKLDNRANVCLSACQSITMVLLSAPLSKL